MKLNKRKNRGFIKIIIISLIIMFLIIPLSQSSPSSDNLKFNEPLRESESICNSQINDSEIFDKFKDKFEYDRLRPKKILRDEFLDYNEINLTLNSDRELKKLYKYVKNKGFKIKNSIKRSYDNGDKILFIEFDSLKKEELILIHPISLGKGMNNFNQKPFLAKIEKINDTTVALKLFDEEGGLYLDLKTYKVIETWDSHHSC